MATQLPRFTVSIDPKINEQLLDLTERRTPSLTKRYVVELALTRLFEDVNRGQLELGLELKHARGG